MAVRSVVASNLHTSPFFPDNRDAYSQGQMFSSQSPDLVQKYGLQESKGNIQTNYPSHQLTENFAVEGFRDSNKITNQPSVQIASQICQREVNLSSSASTIAINKPTLAPRESLMNASNEDCEIIAETGEKTEETSLVMFLLKEGTFFI